MSLMRGVWVDAERERRPRAGGLPARRRRSRDAGARSRRRARLRLGHRHRGTHAGRRLRVSDAALGLDIGQRRRDGRRHRRGTAGAGERRSENADLFWGLRGGGGNFGVVTGIDYALHPVGPEVVGGVVAWPRERGAQGARALSPLAAQAASRADAGRADAPGASGAVAAQGDARPADRRHARLPQRAAGGGANGRSRAIKAFGSRSATFWCAGPTRRCRRCSTRTQPKGRRYYWKSEYLPRIEPALCDEGHRACGEDPLAALRGDLSFQIEGALNRLDDGAFAGRQSRRPLRAQRRRVPGSRRPTTRANIDWARDAWSDMKRVLDRRQLHQLPDRRRRPGAYRGRAGYRAPAAGGGQGEMGCAKRVPDEPEHRAGLIGDERFKPIGPWQVMLQWSRWRAISAEWRTADRRDGERSRSRENRCQLTATS